MKRSPLRRRTRLRAVGKVSRRRAANLRALWPLLLERSAGRCEWPHCGVRRPLDPDHIVKRSQGGQETLQNILAVCRRCHGQRDLAAGHRDALRAWLETVDGEAWFVFLRQGERLRRKLLADGRRLGPVETTLEEALEP